MIDSLTLLTFTSQAAPDLVESPTISLSKVAQAHALQLLEIASHNLNQIVEIVIIAVADATNCLTANQDNVLEQNYSILQAWLPSSRHYPELVSSTNSQDFQTLILLDRLLKKLAQPVDSLPATIAVVQEALSILAQYTSWECKSYLQDYNYCLQQQYEYTKFFSQVCGRLLPDPRPLIDLIEQAALELSHDLTQQVNTLSIEAHRPEPSYYQEAIQYFKAYAHLSASQPAQTLTYNCLARLARQAKEDQAARTYYIQSLKIDHQQPAVYEQLGCLFFNHGNYQAAIDCYKVINHNFDIKQSFKAWLALEPRSAAVRFKRAVYFASLGLSEKAISTYYEAASLTLDQDI